MCRCDRDQVSVSNPPQHLPTDNSVSNGLVVSLGDGHRRVFWPPANFWKDDLLLDAIAMGDDRV